MNELLQSLIPVLVFVTCVLLVLGGYLFWAGGQESGTEKVRTRIRRLSAAAAEQAEAEKYVSLARQEGLSSLDAALLRVPRLHGLDRFLEQAGVQYGPASYLFLCLLSAAVGAAIVLLFTRSLESLALVVGVIAGALIPYFILSRRRTNRRLKLAKQVPEALDFFARSLRAGTPFSGAIKVASEELPPPIAGELEITFDELNYGLTFEDAMRNLSSRLEIEEVRLFVTAVLVQKSTGGNLAELLNRIAKLLRERITAQGEVRIQASEMRMSARVLIVLPFVVAGMLQLVNPEYFPVLLESDIGQTLIVCQIVLMAIGYFIINRMVSFRI